MNILEYDLIVVGSGGAGCAAALEASKLGCSTLLLTNGTLENSKSWRAQSGLQAVFHPEDRIEYHIEDTIIAGQGAAKTKLVEILANEAPSAVLWLEKIGVKFDKNLDGSFLLKTVGGARFPRVLGAGAQSGVNIMMAVLEEVKRNKIQIFENAPVRKISIIDLSQKNVTSTGFEIVTDNEKLGTIKCKSVVLATGSLVPKSISAGIAAAENDKMNLPDAVDLASGLGAEVCGAELMQYHPTGVVWPEQLRRERLPETMRSEGAKLINKYGEEFVDEALTRKNVTDAIIAECENERGLISQSGHKGVLLTTPDLEKKNGSGFIENKYPTFFNKFMEIGFDLRRKPVMVFPILHYSLGGLVVDESAMTTVGGLFAAGENTWGIHGKERIAGNSLTDIFVFGRRAGKSAGRWASK